MKRSQIYGLLLAAILAATGLVLQYLEIGDQRAIIVTASEVIASYGEQVEEQRAVINDVLNLNNNLVDEIAVLGDNVAQLEGAVAGLEDIANSRRCQSIDRELFDNNIYQGTSYVITPAKMGWNGFWSVRENVVLLKDYGLARGFEFRIDLTPENHGDFWQEIHTTVRAFSSAEEAKASFDASPRDETRAFETSLDFGVPLDAWGAVADENSQTMKIEFLCGNYRVEVKIKYLPDPALAFPILEQAVLILFGEISQWAP